MNFYDSIIEGAQELTVQERGQLYAACLEYLYYGREPDFAMRPVPRAMFTMVHPVLENQRAKMEAGSKGGRATGESKARTGNRNASKTQAERKRNASKAPSETQAERKQEQQKTQAGTQAELFPETQAKRKQNASEQEQEQEQEREEPYASAPDGAEALSDAADKFAGMRRRVIAHLNAVTGAHFEPNSAKTRRHLDARLREGRTVEDCLRVIDVKSSQWLGSDMARYLRPETLFGPKFEGYLNEGYLRGSAESEHDVSGYEPEDATAEFERWLT